MKFWIFCWCVNSSIFFVLSREKEEVIEEIILGILKTVLISEERKKEVKGKLLDFSTYLFKRGRK